MSLLPFIFDDYVYNRPSRILDQHFGSGLTPEDLLEPFTAPTNMMMMRNPLAYYRPWRTRRSERDVGSTVKSDKDKFQVNLDVQQFRPEEISVKITGENTITIEGKHEEKEDEHGYISRHFVRRYVLPKGHNMDKIESKLSSDGVLTIIAPKIDAKEIGHRTIPVIKTGQPSKPIENGTHEEEKKK